MRFEIPNMREGYPGICQYVVENGNSVAPRGEATHELLDVTIVVNDPADTLPIGTGRKLVLAIGAVEALQLIAGASFPDLTCRVAPAMRRFMDGGTFHGAYGPRTRQQMPQVIKKLQDDPDTRQAVITIWDPALDNFDGLHDYPCTVMLQFLIRNDELQLHVTMRSNDVWWGLAYDAFQFSQLQCAVANCLKMTAGSYFHHAVSLHAYERDFESIKALHAPVGLRAEHYAGFGSAGEITMPWSEIAADALGILDGTFEPTESMPTERWYWNTLEPYRVNEQLELT